ncbi:MAG: hypothetical protein U0R50_10765 [Gaiellales bacterium]
MFEHPFAAELLCAPAGVALLDALEVFQRRDVAWFETPSTSSPRAVERAAGAIEQMSFGEFLRIIVSSAENVGSWRSDAPGRLINAYRNAPARTSIAEAVAARFAVELGQDVGLAAQESWGSPDGFGVPLFADHDRVYCCGEFSWAGLRTVTDPPPEVHDDLVSAWEMESPEPIARWRLPVTPGARVFEVHGAEDWARLVRTYPRCPVGPHGSWELPGPNQHPSDVHDLAIVSAGAAARTAVAVAMPHWSRVAADFDGVHLSWKGLIAAEGRVVPVPELGENVVTMLRYWSSERTLWLNDVFGQRELLGSVTADSPHSWNGLTTSTEP